MAEDPTAGAWSLLAGDFDGDGRDDIVGLEPPDLLGRTRLRFHYFDALGTLKESHAFERLVVTPVVGDVNQDGKSDLIFSDFRINLFPGRRDRALVPETFSSYRFFDSQLRMVSVHKTAVENTIAAAALLTRANVSGFFVVDPTTGVLRLQGAVSTPIDALAGDPVSGNINEDVVSSPCREVVAAARGQTSFMLFDVCRSDDTGAVHWRDQVLERSVALEPPAEIDNGALVEDVNGDGHLDVLIGAGNQAYVAYGDGAELTTAVPYRLDRADNGETSAAVPMPLAARDFSGDGTVDLVFGDRLLVSSPPIGNSRPKYSTSYTNFGAPWNRAQIADINGNGKLDVIAASKTGINIDLFNGRDSEYLFNSKLTTLAPVKQLATGDFDGDLIDDIAFTQTDAYDPAFDEVRLAFGEYYAAHTSSIQVARVASGSLLVASPEVGLDSLLIISNRLIEGRAVVDMALLFGGDRLPYAPLQLSSFAADGSVNSSAAFGLGVGAYSGIGQRNVIALASETVFDGREGWHFWMVPSVTVADNFSERLPGNLDPRLAPAQRLGSSGRIDIAATSGDFDGDGLDEAVWAIPTQDRLDCGLVFVGSTKTGVALKGTTLLDAACIRTQVQAVDADLDGATDIAMLLAPSGNDARELVVFWNDGQGQFSNDHRTSLSGEDSPQQFTHLLATNAQVPTFAYVTETEAVTIASNGEPRGFTQRRVLTPLVGGSGIVAADINGDGVSDLVLAASGTIQVLMAELNVP